MKKQILVLAVIFVSFASSEWILKELSVPRVRPAVAQVGNKIYIAGGEISGGIETDSIEVLNTDNFDFEQLNISLPSPRQRFTAVPIGSKIFFTGGTQNNIDVFDTSSNSWSALTVAELANFTITFAGTLEGQLVLTTSTGVALFIDPGTGKATSLLLGSFAPIAIPPTRTFLQAPEYNGKIYIAHGSAIVGFNTTSSQLLPPRSDPRLSVNHMLVAQNLLFLADVRANQLYFYHLEEARWDARLLSFQRTDHSVASVGSTVYVLGGVANNGSDYTTGFYFDLKSESLSQPIDLKVPRSQMTPFVAPNAALFIGGLTDSGNYSSTIDIIYEGELKPPTAPTPRSSNNPASVTSGCGELLTSINVVIIAIMSVWLFY